MQAVHFRPGGPENLYLADVPLPELWSKHVHLRVIGTAINRADLLQRKGLYPPPQGTTNILGLEATGIQIESHRERSHYIHYSAIKRGIINLIILICRRSSICFLFTFMELEVERV